MNREAARSARPRLVAATGAALAAILLLAPLSVSAATRPAPTTAATLNKVKLVSYYPTSASWTGMWTQWSQTTTDADFARIAALNANAVRIVVFPSVFGYPTPTSDMTQRLAATVNSANAHGLKVVFTLFDWWVGYGDIAGSSAWASTILHPYVGDTRIAFVELKNEMDPSDAAAMTWARALLPQVRAQLGNTLVTISTAAGLDRMAALKAALGTVQPSFWDYHYYGDGNGDAAAAQATLAQAKAIAAPLPLFIGETGLSTSYPVGVDRATAEAQQDHFLRTVEQATVNLALPPAAVWTLNDVLAGTEPPFVTLPPEEYGFGLYGVDGTAKPAAASIARFFSTGSTNASKFTFNLEWHTFDALEGQLALDPLVRYNGLDSARLAITTGGMYGVPSFVMSPIDAAITPGHSATMSAWAKGLLTTGQNTVALVWFSATGQYLGQSESSALPTGTYTWRKVTVTGVAPPGAAFVQLSVKSAMNLGTVWFDNVAYSHT